jgi:FkbM family methyltransferase
MKSYPKRKMRKMMTAQTSFDAFDRTWKFTCWSHVSADRAKMSFRYYRPMWEGDRIEPLNKKDVVVDIGAHMGFFTVPISSQVKQVIAFEPAAANFKLLQTNLFKNQVTNVHAFPYAVGEEDGVKDFYVGRSTMGHSILFHSNRKNVGPVSVVSLGTICKYKPTVLKIDCEGGEYLILTQANLPYLSNIRLIVVELHQTHKYDPNIVIKVLRRAGFKTILEGDGAFKKLIAYKEVK